MRGYRRWPGDPTIFTTPNVTPDLTIEDWAHIRRTVREPRVVLSASHRGGPFHARTPAAEAWGPTIRAAVDAMLRVTP